MRPARVKWCCEHCGKKAWMRPYACNYDCWLCHECAKAQAAAGTEECPHHGPAAPLWKSGHAWREGAADRLRQLREVIDEDILPHENWVKGHPVAVAIAVMRRYARLRAIVDEVDPEVLQAAEHQAKKRGVIKRLTPPGPLPVPNSKAGNVLAGAILGALGGFALAKAAEKLSPARPRPAAPSLHSLLRPRPKPDWAAVDAKLRDRFGSSE